MVCPLDPKRRVLATRLETVRFEAKVALRDVPRYPPEQAAKDPLKVERQRRPAAARRGLDPMPTHNPQSRSGADPREAVARLDDGQLPKRRGKLRLADHYPG